MVKLIKTHEIVDDILDLIFYKFEEKVFHLTLFFGSMYNMWSYMWNLPVESLQLDTYPQLSAIIAPFDSTILNSFSFVTTAPFGVAKILWLCISFLFTLPITQDQFVNSVALIIYGICVCAILKIVLKPHYIYWY